MTQPPGTAFAAGAYQEPGRPVADDGTVGAVTEIPNSSAVNETAPAIAASESSHAYFVTWSHPLGIVDKPIKGQVIYYDGSKQGKPLTFSGVAADQSAVAAGAMGDFFTVWKDQPISATNTDLFGQLSGNRVYLPVTLKP